MRTMLAGLGTALALLTLHAAAAEAQDPSARWYAQLDGGYATSLDATLDSPGGGPAVSGFLGYRLGRTVTLGATVGWHQFVNGVSTSPSTCPPIGTTLDCTLEYDQQEDALELGAAVRVGKPDGAWRPYGQLGIAYYRSDRVVDIALLDPDGDVISRSGEVNSDAGNGAGANLAVGIGYAPGAGRWTVNASTRLHGVLANTSGDVVWNTWLGFSLGVGIMF